MFTAVLLLIMFFMSGKGDLTILIRAFFLINTENTWHVSGRLLIWVLTKPGAVRLTAG